ncbi:polysaccharide pyruvyl transferase family protein [Tistrella bauzanensis]|uniref:Polysaccharide pyruvyl transferase family protein n=1 Tax=Tistrella arctica TaxID=3133430 RepID=A0ABU9YS17_9PROT
MKICFVNDSTSQNNWGCRATTYAMYDLIRQTDAEVVSVVKLGALNGVGMDLFSLKSRAISLLKEYAYDKPRLRASLRFMQHAARRKRHGKLADPVTLADFDMTAREVQAGRLFPVTRAAIDQADLILVNGEGSIYNFEKKGRMTLFWMYYAKKYAKKKCAIVNHTVQLNDPRMLEIFKAVYPILDDVVFREPASYDEAMRYFPYLEEDLAADAAFRWKPLMGDHFLESYGRLGACSIFPYDAGDFDPSKPYLCITGSSALVRAEDKDPIDRAPFFELCARLKDIGGQVVVVAPDITDETLLAPVAREMKLPFLPAATPLGIGLDILANARVFVSGRWHPSILASTGGTPSVLFSGNTHKIAGLGRLLGLPDASIDAKRLGDATPQILDMTRRFLDEGEVRRSDILARVAGHAKLAERNVRCLMS